MQVSRHAALDELSPAAVRLFASPNEDLFASELWFATLLQHARPAGWAPQFVECTANGVPTALLPLIGAQKRGAVLQSLTGLYSLTFRPLLAPEASPAENGAALGRFCRAIGLVRLDALAPETPGFAEFAAGLRRAGLTVLKFDNFGNWYEPVAGKSFGEFLDARPGVLRSTIRRKMRHALGVGDFAVVTGEPGLTAAIQTYEAVYARSWKPAEPFPSFHAALIRAAAAHGLLRLGVLHLSGQAAAVQLWIVCKGRAIVLKLAHDESLVRFSPGTVLTALMIERLLGEEHLIELDFGRGDDPYKQLWTSRRRQRLGFMLADPLKPRGLAEISRSALGAVRRKVLAVKRTQHTLRQRRGASDAA
ncbi:MAG: GNAT family N-acetyltransferase [Acetobacteraceae bacterium]